MADNNTIARPYAQALFDVARAGDSLAAFSEALEAARDIMSDGRIEAFLGNPSLSDAKRFEFLQGTFARAMGQDSVFAGGSRHGENFLRLLIEYDRVSVLPEIADHFDALKSRVENSIDVTVTSATPLSDAQQREIVAALRKRFDREVTLETRVDESLIGGAVIRAGDVVIDGSLRARLNGLANALVA